MSVTLEDLSRETGLSESELRLELAVRLFELARLTLGQASRLAGLAQLAFQRVLGERRPEVRSLLDDLRTRAGLWVSQSTYEAVLADLGKLSPPAP